MSDTPVVTIECNKNVAYKTRTFNMSRPMTRKVYPSTRINRRHWRDLDVLRGSEVAETIGWLLSCNDSVYCVTLENPYRLSIGLRAGVNWETRQRCSEHGEGEITTEEHVALILSEHLGVAMKHSFEQTDFMRHSRKRNPMTV